MELYIERLLDDARRKEERESEREREREREMDETRSEVLKQESIQIQLHELVDSSAREEEEGGWGREGGLRESAREVVEVGVEGKHSHKFARHL